MADTGSGQGGVQPPDGVPPPPPARPPLDAEQMFRVAAGYEEAGDVVGQYSVGRVIAGGPAPTLIPMAMLSAFTLELYLKCLVLLVTGTAARKVHGIVDLFHTVSAARQADIRAAFLAGVGRNPAFVFDQFLHDVDNAFHQWRYYHEYNPTTGTQADMIYQPVKQVILGMRPDWRGIYPRA